ncbi:MAG TPA: glycosyltransferase [Bacteroidales bacterium]|nr:glycosyltransferase [Bacteroidales bacterium]HPT09307.1 glycosyltransferase [Bacteroidales bacterium]
MKVSVILPTYNEKESINLLIREISTILEKEALDYEVLIVDDMSPDGTYDAVKTVFADDSRVVPLLRKNERGLATAVLYGIRKARGEKIVVMDTDFNHPSDLIPLLVKIVDHFDIATGSRYVIGGGMETSRFRYLGSKLFNRFIRYMLSVRTTDNLSGFFAFRKEILDSVDPTEIFYGYGDYFIRFLYRMQKQGKQILEIPVVYKDRKGGLSKTNLKNELLRYTKTVIKIRLGIWEKPDNHGH